MVRGGRHGCAQEESVSETSSRSRKAAWVSRFVRAIVAIVIVAIGLGVYSGLVATREEARRISEPPPPRVVQTIRASSRTIPRRWVAYGTTRALRSTEIAAEVSSIVLDRPASIQPGATVASGDMIVTLDAHDFDQAARSARERIASLEAQVESLNVEQASLIDRVELAEESVALAREELERAKEAQSASGIGGIEVNRLRRSVIALERDAAQQRERLNQIPPRRADLRAQIERERTNLRLAQRNIERCTIEAPYEGTLQRIDVQEGERVSPGMTVARLVDRRKIEIPLSVAASGHGSIRVGDRVFLRASGASSEGSSDESWTGRVSRIAPEADSGSRTITVFAVVEQDASGDEGAPLLLPGRFVIGAVEGRAMAGVIPVPRKAVTEDRVLVMNGAGRIEERDVRVRFYTDDAFPEIDPQERQWAIVTGELKPGERVVTSNLDELEVGVIVTDAGADALETARAENGNQES